MVGTTAYLTNQSSGLVIIDITDPTNPIVDINKYIDTAGTASNLAVSGNYVYVADGREGLAIINVNQIPPREVPVRSASIRPADDIEIAGSYAYIATSSGGGSMRIIDITDPAVPGTPLSVSMSGQHFDLEIQNNFAYVTSYFNVDIVDITNPTAPGVPVRVPMPAGPPYHYATRISVSGASAFIGGSGFLYSLDITNPAIPGAPQLMFASGITGFDTVGPYLYVADSSGLRILDASDVANATEIAAVPLGSVRSVSVFGNYAYLISNQNDRLYIVDVSDPNNPGKRRSVSVSGSKVYVSGNYAYLSAGSEGFNVVDISNQNNPVWVGNYATLTSANGIAVSGNYALVADYYAGVSIVNLQQQVDFQITSQAPITNGVQYNLTWSVPPNNTADTKFNCIVDVGTCTYSLVDQVSKQATVNWTLPPVTVPGVYSINLHSGNWHYFNGLRREVIR